MKNDFRILGDKTIIFIKRRTGEIIETFIDTEDLEKVKGYKGAWHVQWKQNNSFYVSGSIREAPNKYGKLHLHRLIMDTPAHLVVDHINHNTLDNRKKNLRNVTQLENLQNRNKRKLNYHAGVSWHKNDKKYQARIQVKGKRIWLGNFDNREEAQYVVNEAKEKFWRD